MIKGIKPPDKVLTLARKLKVPTTSLIWGTGAREYLKTSFIETRIRWRLKERFSGFKPTMAMPRAEAIKAAVLNKPSLLASNFLRNNNAPAAVVIPKSKNWHSSSGGLGNKSKAGPVLKTNRSWYCPGH
jgi:hypothetical protein